MDIVNKFIELDNKQKVMVFLSIFSVYYLFALNNGSLTGTFFILMFAFIIYSLNTQSQAESKHKIQNITQYISSMEELVRQHDTPEMVVELVYKIHKPLKTLRFIKSNNDICQILYDLRFMLNYDKENFIDLTVYIEYFLKIHFNVMIGKYEPTTNVNILKDIRVECLNLLHSTHFNIPNISTTFDSKDLDRNLKSAILKFQALSFRYMKVVYKKYKKELIEDDYKGSFGVDKGKNSNFHIY